MTALDVAEARVAFLEARLETDRQSLYLLRAMTARLAAELKAADLANAEPQR